MFDQADVLHNDTDLNSGNNIEHESLRSPTEGKLGQTTEKSKREGVVGVISDVNEVLTASSEMVRTYAISGAYHQGLSR